MPTIWILKDGIHMELFERIRYLAKQKGFPSQKSLRTLGSLPKRLANGSQRDAKEICGHTSPRLRKFSPMFGLIGSGVAVDLFSGMALGKNLKQL